MIIDRMSIVNYTCYKDIIKDGLPIREPVESMTFDIITQNPNGVFFLNSAAENVPNNINSDKVVAWHGENVQSMFMGVRVVDLEGIIFMSQSTPAAILTRKRELERVFNPTITGELEYGRIGENKRFYLRSCRVAEKVNFAVEQGGNLRWWVTVRAHNPFWQQRTELVRLAFVQKNAFFPRSYPQTFNAGGINPSGGKMYFGLRRNNLETVVENVGDVETGFELMFTALGELDNPRITNLDTGDTIRLTLKMQKDDFIKVVCFPKEFKVIKKDGTNGAMLLDPTSNPFFLQAGSTKIAFNADLNVSNLDVSLKYPPQFLGAENFWGGAVR